MEGLDGVGAMDYTYIGCVLSKMYHFVEKFNMCVLGMFTLLHYTQTHTHTITPLAIRNTITFNILTPNHL